MSTSLAAGVMSMTLQILIVANIYEDVAGGLSLSCLMFLVTLLNNHET